MNTTPSLSRRAALGWLASAAVPALAAKPALMLARETAAPVDPTGWLVSEKYDGVRAVWDGRVLRLRSGLPIAAPRWFTEPLPAEPLDGELWFGRGRFEALAAAVRRQRPDEAEWRAVRWMLFDQPGTPDRFALRAARVQALVQRLRLPQLVAAPQHELADRAALQRLFDDVVTGGGEGLVLQRADARWQPGRSDALLKWKPLADADAVVVGHEPGQGRLAGRLGALRVRDEAGHEFRIGTGFSDAQRAAPPAPGTTVTYTHRGFTAGGTPRFASFLRVRADA